VGAQNEVQVGLVRASGTAPLALADGSVNAEALTARANYGFANDDGSTGANFGATAQLVGFESTLSHSGWSVTSGLSAQIGGYGSVGFRDADHDGKTEFCAKISAPAVTLGVCMEDPIDLAITVVKDVLHAFEVPREQRQ